MSASKPTSTQSPLRRMIARLGLEREWYLIGVAAVIGVVMGAVAMAFIMPLRAVEEWVEHSNLNGTLILILVVGAPTVGALLTGVVVHFIAGSQRGPGVSAVMYAIHREKAKLHPVLVIRKWLASTLTIASGGSAGAEGPIVTIGSTIGSAVGQRLKVSPQNLATLLGCGAAAGISSIFNAPIAGIFFVMEILLRDFSIRTATLIVVASVASATWTQTMLSAGGQMQPIFPVTEGFFASTEFFTLFELPNYLLLGICCGIFAPLFVRLLFISDSAFSRVRIHPILRPGIGGLMLGLMGLAYLLIRQPDNPIVPFFGNGYPVIRDLLDPAHYFDDAATHSLKPAAVLVMGLLGVTLFKAIGTCLTIGSGGAGGLFAPSLLMGAGLGGTIGVVLAAMGADVNPAHYALVGMAAMVGSTTHAPLTAIFIVWEITKSEKIILPLMFATVISTIVTRLISRDSVYTFKLSRLGVRIGQMSDHTILRRLAVSDVPLAEAAALGQYDSAQRLLDLSERHRAIDFVVVDDDLKYTGMVVGADLRTAMLEREAIPLLLVYELQRTDLPTVEPAETLDAVLDKFSRHDVHSLAVLDPMQEGKVLGLITRDRLMRRYQEALEED